jgi:heme/copper-type cytochrome/quinol oxidase subunit 2
MYYSLNPNAQRAKNAITLLWIVLVLEIASLVSSFLQYDLLQNASSGNGITDAAAEANDLRVRILGIMYMIAYVISAVTFIMWFRRAYNNLHQRASYLSYSEGWAAGSWFVPVLSLFRPYQVMDDMYSETKRLLQSKGFTEVNLNTRLLGWWWALWIITCFIGQFSFRYSLKAETIDELLTSTVAEITNSVIGIPLALLAIRVVKDYAAVEPLLNDMTDEEEPRGTVQFVEHTMEVNTGSSESTLSQI